MNEYHFMNVESSIINEWDLDEDQALMHEVMYEVVHEVAREQHGERGEHGEYVVKYDKQVRFLFFQH